MTRHSFVKVVVNLQLSKLIVIRYLFGEIHKSVVCRCCSDKQTCMFIQYHQMHISPAVKTCSCRNYTLLLLKTFLYHRQGCHGFQERLAASQEAIKNKNIVNLGAIRQGMKRFQFLLNCCEPGTIPDASILAAALDLVSSDSSVYVY